MRTPRDAMRALLCFIFAAAASAIAASDPKPVEADFVMRDFRFANVRFCPRSASMVAPPLATNQAIHVL